MISQREAKTKVYVIYCFCLLTFFFFFTPPSSFYVCQDVFVFFPKNTVTVSTVIYSQLCVFITIV